MSYRSALIQLPLVRESTGEYVRTPEDVYRVCGDIAPLAQESFHVLILDTRNRLISLEMVSLGILDASLVHPREVFRTAIKNGAAAVVLAHNHPSGEITPSAEDIQITRRLIEAGNVLEIKVVDHVIIGRSLEPGSPAYLSIRESGLCQFD